MSTPNNDIIKATKASDTLGSGIGKLYEAAINYIRGNDKQKDTKVIIQESNGSKITISKLGITIS